MGGNHLVLVIMVWGGHVKTFYIVWGPLKKVHSSPPTDLNRTALIKTTQFQFMKHLFVSFHQCSVPAAKSCSKKLISFSFN